MLHRFVCIQSSLPVFLYLSLERKYSLNEPLAHKRNISSVLVFFFSQQAMCAIVWCFWCAPNTLHQVMWHCWTTKRRSSLARIIFSLTQHWNIYKEFQFEWNCRVTTYSIRRHRIRSCSNEVFPSTRDTFLFAIYRLSQKAMLHGLIVWIYCIDSKLHCIDSSAWLHMHT